MTDAEILSTLSGIVADLLGVETVSLGMKTRREDVPDWDSLAYVNFIAMVEVQYGIKFRVAEIEAFRDMGDVVAAIRGKNS
jgi:acyl carrier protein